MEPLELFTPSMEERLDRLAPLAARMRPRTLQQVVGQDHLVGPRGVLRKALEAGSVGSMVFYGPPGTGKTTLARLVAAQLRAEFEELSAVDSGVAQVRGVLERARRRLGERGLRTVLFIDEIHRFSKAQQDALLHAVEDGLVVLIGATTENPHFEVIPALLSRCRLLPFRPLEPDATASLITRALTEGFLPPDSPGVGKGPMQSIVSMGQGDARRSLSILETALQLARAKGLEKLDAETLAESVQRPLVAYGRLGDAHYNYASAFIKSLRGSDPDAALYYLAVLLSGGEDPKFIARRLVVFASEDIGNADPRALEVAVAVSRAVELVGMPECRINLAQAVTYLSCAPKSNASYLAIQEALAEVESTGPLAPPIYLQDARSGQARAFRSEETYVYPHDHGGYVTQAYLPESLRDRTFYSPGNRGYEDRMREFLERMRTLRFQDGRLSSDRHADQEEG